MSDFKATPEQWANQEIWAQSDDDSACILELRARVEALEANSPAKPDSSPAPADSLVERVAGVICDDEMAHLWHDDARAAIREVAAHIRANVSPGPSIAAGIAAWLEQEAGPTFSQED